MGKKVIIIGSGLGGLACAHILLRKGYRVQLLERQVHAGGCMQVFMRGGSYFDTGLHYIGGLDEGQPLHDAFADLGLLDLPWQRLDPDGFDEITVKGKTYRFVQGYDNFVEELSKDFPHEREGLQKYVEMLQTTDEQWLQQTNAYDYLCSIIKDPMLISVISGASLKMELKKDSLPLFTFAHGNGSFIESSWRLKGHGNVLVSKLLDDIRSMGGELVCKADVVELVEEDGRLVRAVCADGRSFEGDVFISNAHPSVSIDFVKDSTRIKNIFRKRINRLENTFGMFTLQMTLKPGTLPYFNHNKFIYDCDDVWAFHQSENNPVKGILVSCPYPLDGGKYADRLDIMTPMTWEKFEKWKDTKVGRRGDDYVALKNRISEECLRLAETRIPDLRDCIDQRYTSTPLTYYWYNRSAEGSAYGIRKDYNNTLGTILSPRTPLPNFFLTGQSLMLHGLHGVTMTAYYTVKAMEKSVL